MDSAKIKILLIGLIIYFLSAGVSYPIFTKTLNKKSNEQVSTVTKNKNGELSFDNTLPKTEPCPLNGALYSRQQKAWWEKHRPLGIMVENHEEARPQSGLSNADVMYEVVAEGGITRFLSVFYCQDAGTIGPVRSARTYFLDFISEYGDNPLYAHVGGANTSGPADALSQIEDYGWQGYNDLNQFSIGFPTFRRDYERIGHEVATEHTMYSSTEQLWKYAAEKRRLTNIDKKGNAWDASFVPYKFKDDVTTRPTSQVVSFEFWEDKAYGVKWDYDKKTNMYFRSNGGVKHVDKNNNKQLTTKNVVILFMSERRANDGYEDNVHLLYGTKGIGKAIVFLDGTRYDATWSKKDRMSHLTLFDKSGKEVLLNKGKIWFEILPVGTEIDVK